MDIESGKVYRSPLLTSTKNVEDKFIYSGWKKFVSDSGLHYKDKLILNAPLGDNYLEVQIIRGQMIC
jgi:hypothetical protein